MSKERSTFSKRGKLMKGTILTFGTVLLGAIGSGLWDVLLSPVFEWLGSAILNTASSIFSSFTDQLYSRVSRNPMATYTVLPYAIFATLIIVFPWFLFAVFRSLLFYAQEHFLNERNKKSERENRSIEELAVFVDRGLRFSWLFIPFTLILTGLYMSTFYQDLHAVRAAVFVERSIAIVAPHVEPSESLRLVASFRSIESAKQFYSLENELRSIAEQHDLTLPEFEAIH